MRRPFPPWQQRELRAARQSVCTQGKGHGRIEHRQLTSSVRNLAMNWLRSQKIDTIAQALRQNAWNPQPLFAMLGKPTQ